MGFLSKVFRFGASQQIHLSAIAAGGAVGALARYAIFPLIGNQIAATLLCNIVGSFLLAATKEMRGKISPSTENMVAVGFCGGLSIFASFSRDSVLAVAADNYALFFTNLLANFAVCVLAVFAAQKFADFVRNHRDALRKIRLATTSFRAGKPKGIVDTLKNAAKNIGSKIGGGK